MEIGLGYLLGSKKLLAEFEEKLSTRKEVAQLVLPLGEFWDGGQGKYLGRFREVVGKFLSRSSPEYEEFQRELLGRKLPDDYAEVYFKQISAFHPIMALLMCKIALGRKIVLRPLLYKDDSVLSFYENPQALVEKPAPKKR
jgi:hypothetical protein